jgi:type IV pilus assembly protein PilF
MIYFKFRAAWSQTRGVLSRALSLAAAGGTLVVLMGGLTGFAVPAGGSRDMLTAADDSDARKRARIHLELAVTYFSEGKTSIALDALKQSLSSDSGLFEAHNLRGLIYMRLNEPALAEEGFKKALSLQPNASSVQHNYAWMLCQQGRMADASAQFSAALANPNYDARAKTMMAHGVCQAKAGEAAAARTSLLGAYQLEPGNPVVVYTLASQLSKQGDSRSALAYIARINESQWANPETLWLGIKLARSNSEGLRMAQWSSALRARFAGSRELGLLERGAFDE